MELGIIFLASTQPLVVGVLAYLGCGRLLSRTLLHWGMAPAQRLTPNRTYECATYTRLSALLTLNTSAITLVFAFLIYDVDLILFVSEVALVSSYGLTELIVAGAFTLFFVGGLVVDYRVSGSSWELF